MSHFRILPYLFILLVANASPAYPLDQGMEADILIARITGLLKAEKNAEALPLFEQLESMNAKLPESFDYYYVETLDKAGRAEKALVRGETYLKKFGKKGKYYGQVIEIVARRRPEVEAKAKADAEQAKLNKAMIFRKDAARFAEYGDLAKVQGLLMLAENLIPDPNDEVLRNKAKFYQPLFEEYGEHYSKNYRDNGDGSVTHIKTGKVWKRCLYSQDWDGLNCRGRPKEEWVWIRNRYDGWQLPSRDELKQLFYCKSNPTESPDDQGVCSTGSATMNPIAFRFYFGDWSPQELWTRDESKVQRLSYGRCGREGTVAKHAWIVTSSGRVAERIYNGYGDCEIRGAYHSELKLPALRIKE